VVNIILRFSSLGDIVLCEALCRGLKERDPKAPLVFASSAQLIDITRSFVANPDFYFPLQKKGFFSYFWDSYTFISDFHKKTPIDKVVIYDLHRVPKSFFARIGFAFFCLTHKIPFVIRGTPKRTFKRRLSIFLRKDLLGKRHIFKEHLKLLGNNEISLEPQLKRRSHSLDTRDSTIKRILIAPDSQHWKKKWPISYWEKLFEKFKTLKDCEFTLVGSADIFPQDLVDQLTRNNTSLIVKNRLGKLPLSDLSLIASDHDLCICGNSAWQHISEAAGVNVISLAGPIIEGFGFSPWRAESQELSVPLKCRPCTRHGDGMCDQKEDLYHACMRNITPEILYNEIVKKLRMQK